MVASLSVCIAFVGMKVLLLGQLAGSKRVVTDVETEPASLLMAQSTQGSKDDVDDDVEESDTRPHSRSHSRHHRGGSRGGRSKGKVEPDNEGPFADDHGELAMGGDNKNECHERYESIETQEECEEAAEKIGGILGFHMSEDNPTSPHGCYRQGGGYYLNSNAGAPKSGSSKVCKISAKYCPPDVESYCAKSVCGDEAWDKEHCPTTCQTCQTADDWLGMA